MKRLLLIFFLLPILCFGQKYGNIWYFSDDAGIDFNTCTPTPLMNGKIPPSEGCATICDTSGQLLFYTNSDTVWNKQHHAMPNGILVPSNGTLSQVLIVPKPLSQNIFYVITTQIQGTSSLNLEYHTIDMTLNGGLGDVINKNNVLTTATVTEQVAATYHGNGTDIWIATHEYGNNKFQCYLVNSSGINLTPVSSNVGPSIIPCSSGFNARGEIKFSPNSMKIAFNNNGIGTNPNSDYLCLFDFNNNTGTVSNPINLPYERGGFALSFSSDNSKLYGATWKAFSFSASDTNKLFQFDITSNDSTMISNSKIILAATPQSSGSYFGSLKLAPDGKIYVAKTSSTYLGVINSPNQSGTMCNYISNGFYLGGKIARIGLNNYIEYTTYCATSSIDNYSYEQKVSVYPNPTSDQFFIEANTTDKLTVDLYDVNGRHVFSANVSDKSDINITTLDNGAYSLTIKTADRVTNKKIIILR